MRGVSRTAAIAVTTAALVGGGVGPAVAETTEQPPPTELTKLMDAIEKMCAQVDGAAPTTPEAEAPEAPQAEAPETPKAPEAQAPDEQANLEELAAQVCSAAEDVNVNVLDQAPTDTGGATDAVGKPVGDVTP